jgi:hypothetical protein
MMSHEFFLEASDFMKWTTEQTYHCPMVNFCSKADVPSAFGISSDEMDPFIHRIEISHFKFSSEAACSAER